MGLPGTRRLMDELEWLHSLIAQLDRLAPAREAYQAALPLAEAAGDRNLIATALAGIGTEKVRSGEINHTEELQEALSLALELGNDRVAAAALARLGFCSQNEGNYVDALRKFE